MKMESTHIVVAGRSKWRLRKVDGYLIASCPALNIVVWGETKEELEVKQQQAVLLTLLYLHGQGILRSFLEKRGFSVNVSTTTTVWDESLYPDAPPRGPHVHPCLQYEYA